MKPSLVFFGNERIATGVTTNAPILRALIEAGYPVETLIVNHEPPRSRKERKLEVLEVAEAHNIPVLTPRSNDELRAAVAPLKSKAAILVAYGRMVPQSVIDHFPGGIVNVHPSVLPKHRGSIPIESVILSRETETGVSLMQLAREMDAGPVYTQTNLQLSGAETKQELADILIAQSISTLIERLPSILDGSLLPTAQDESLATYDQRIAKTDGVIDWGKSADQIEREIRAYAGWPRSRTNLHGREVIITEARVSDNKDDLSVQCGDGKFLTIERLVPTGKKEMTAQEFLRGFRSHASDI